MSEQVKKGIIGIIGDQLNRKRIPTPRPNIFSDDKAMDIVNRVGHAVYLRMVIILTFAGYAKQTYDIIVNLTYKDDRWQTIAFMYTIFSAVIYGLSKQIKDEEKYWHKMYLREQRIASKWQTLSDMLKTRVNTPMELLAYLGVVLDDEGLITNTIVTKVLENQMKLQENLSALPHEIANQINEAISSVLGRGDDEE